jgi:hypothetical protein
MLTPRRSNRLAGLEPEIHPMKYYNINKDVPESDSEDVIPESGTALETCAEITMIFTAVAVFAWLLFSNTPPSVHFHAI